MNVAWGGSAFRLKTAGFSISGGKSSPGVWRSDPDMPRQTSAISAGLKKAVFFILTPREFLVALGCSLDFISS
jgi:hypothetical protein